MQHCLQFIARQAIVQRAAKMQLELLRATECGQHAEIQDAARSAIERVIEEEEEVAAITTKNAESLFGL